MGLQTGWRWCHKCQGFFYAGFPSQGVCPADHQAHDASQSGHYAAVHAESLLPISEVATSQPSGGLIPAAFGITNPFVGVAVMGEATSERGAGVWSISNKGTGVSMAAPHVSGTIAAFLSIRGEFIGRPDEVKRIFLKGATSLVREKYFEGQGLVDPLDVGSASRQIALRMPEASFQPINVRMTPIWRNIPSVRISSSARN